MKSTWLRRSFMASVAAALVAVLCGPSLADGEEIDDGNASAISPRVQEVLGAMKAQLQSVDTVRIEARVTFDDVPISGVKVQYSGEIEVLADRPTRLFVDYRDDLSTKRVWIDGENLTLWDPLHNVYAVVPAKQTVKATLEEVQADFGLSLPLQDFIVTESLDKVLAEARASRYLGRREVEGVPCHHLVVAQKTFSWQIWVETGDRALPKKLVITYDSLDGAPQFAVLFEAWNLGFETPDALFQSALPDSATKIDFIKLKEVTE